MDVRQAIDHGALAATHARTAREDIRWKQRRDDPMRVASIADALFQIDQAMTPIRSLMGALRWRPDITALQEERLREVSKSLQYERRQLKKMR